MADSAAALEESRQDAFGAGTPVTWASLAPCLGLSLLAGLSTTLGALVVFVMPGNKVPPHHMAFILAFAAGVMLSTSVLGFWAPALAGGKGGEAWRVLFYSGLGAALFLAFAALVPEPALIADKESPRPSPASDLEDAIEADGLVTESGSRAAASTGRPPPVSVVGRSTCPPPVPQSPRLSPDAASRRWRLAVVMMISLTAHNFPEGMAVAISSLDDRRLGLVVMIAISIHNVPEGVAISVPVLAATGSRWKALLMTLISGFAEPLGAVIALGLATVHGAPSKSTMHNMLCVVGGVMAAVALKELLPESLRLGRQAASAAGFVTGACLMAVTEFLGA